MNHKLAITFGILLAITNVYAAIAKDSVPENAEAVNDVSASDQDSHFVPENEKESFSFPENHEKQDVVSEINEEVQVLPENHEEEAHAVPETDQQSHDVSENDDESQDASENDQDSHFVFDNNEEAQTFPENHEKQDVVPESNKEVQVLPENHKEEAHARPETDQQSQDATENDYELHFTPNEALHAVSVGLNSFSRQFYKKLSHTKTRNLISSPLSVGLSLAMLAQGARGYTEKEMHQALHLPEDKDITMSGFESLIDSVNSARKVRVHVGGKVVVHKEFEVNSQFESDVETYFQSAVDSVDFDDTDEASGLINQWIEEETDEYVKNIVKPADVSGAGMVLVDAVYFRGSWQNKFKHADTVPRAFSIDKKFYKIIPTMYQKNTFNYGTLPELNNAAYIELPYEHEGEHDDMSMFIVVPKEITGLRKLINCSEKIDYQQLHYNPQMTPVQLYLPKFKVRSTLNLRPVLEKLGLKDMFQSSANFTGIVEETQVKLDKYVQKAFIDVNEGENESHGVSTGVADHKSESITAGQKVKHLYVDHPFMFVIHHWATNTVLFQGHVKIPATR